MRTRLDKAATGQGQDKTAAINSIMYTYLRLRVELRAEERLGLVSDTLVSPVVDVREQRFPPVGELGVVDGEAVVLRGDVALVRQAVHHRLGNEGCTRREGGGGGC